MGVFSEKGDCDMMGKSKGSVKGVLTCYDLLNETRAGHYATSLENLEVILSKYYSEYVRTGAIPRTKESAIMKYSHLEMAKKFAHLLDKVQTEAPGHSTATTCSDSAQKFTQ